MPRILLTSFLAVCLLPFCSQGESANAAIGRATAAVDAAVPRAQADPAHPIFHVAAPAQWMNDPNGPIFYKGWYHLFYQLTPFSDESGVKYWGHVRSRNLVTWEHLPIALWPSTEAGEAGVWSGCCTINGEGVPMIFYTSVKTGKSPMTHSEQWAATSDDDMIHWQKSPDNPVLTEALHNGQKIYDWRDPFIFRDHKRTFMVTGGNLNQAKGGQAVVTIYEAQNAGLTKWKYRGVLFHVPDAPTAECPNFFKLGNEWVLFVSPYGKVRYFVGEFNVETCRFQPRTHGLLDQGPNFYAPNTLQLASGRRLVWGWVNGFPAGHGWNGCLSLPRQLSLSRAGRLQQAPAPQLRKLRGKPVQWRNLRLENQNKTLTLPRTNALEILAELQPGTARSVVMEFRSGDQSGPPMTLSFDGAQLKVMNVSAPLQLNGGSTNLKLRIFIDRSVMEIFANQTVAITKTIPLFNADADLEIRAEGGTANLKQLEAWPMRSIWQTLRK